MPSEYRVKVFKDRPVCAWDWECTCGRRDITWYVRWSQALGMAIHHLKMEHGEEERDGQQAQDGRHVG
jgi:hypothetical protein